MLSSVCRATTWLLFFLLSACASVTYDSVADQGITKLTTDINSQLINWRMAAESGQPTPYDEKFYNNIETQLTTLEIRMESSQDPATAKIVSVFESLKTQMEGLRQLHQSAKKPLSKEFLTAEAMLLNAQLAALTTFELSLKGTQSTSSASTTSTATTNTQKAANAANASAVVKNATSN